MEGNIDVVISNYQVPGMSPHERSSTIRDLTSIRNTRLILLTNLLQREDILKAKEIGFDAYLVKPIKRDELLGLVIMVTGLQEKESNSNVIIAKYAQKELQKANMPRILLAENNIINQRLDWLHKASYILAENYDAVIVEDIHLRAMAQTFKLPKNLTDNRFGMFRNFLKYKLEDRGKQFIKIDNGIHLLRLVVVAEI